MVGLRSTRIGLREASSGCGGVIRNDAGYWVKVFGVNMENNSAFVAELWGVLQGLELAWDLSMRRLEVESDSQAAISCTSANKNNGHQHTLIRRILVWAKKGLEIVFNHTYRERNKCALANWELRQDLVVQVLESPLESCLVLLAMFLCHFSLQSKDFIRLPYSN